MRVWVVGDGVGSCQGRWDVQSGAGKGGEELSLAELSSCFGLGHSCVCSCATSRRIVFQSAYFGSRAGYIQ